MLFADPPPSQGDLHFRVFGIPVRVHPFFWLTTVILSLGGEEVKPGELISWVAVVFFSVLIHELGHAFTQRRFGGRPWITLHGIGGLASSQGEDDRPSSQILIALAGPAAGFAFALAVIVLMRVTGHLIGWSFGESSPHSNVLEVSLFGGVFYWTPLSSEGANRLLWNILWVNIGWGLINLLPVYPLDGGRVSRELCTLGRARSTRDGIILSLRISMIAAALMAAVGLLAWQSIYTALMFGYLAYTSYSAMQAYQYRGY